MNKKKEQYDAFSDVVCKIEEWNGVFELHTTLKLLAKQQSVSSVITILRKIALQIASPTNGSAFEKINA